MARMIAAASLWLVALAAPAHAQAIRWVPELGTPGYRYESRTNIPGAPGNGYRMDYDLVSDGKGGLVVVVHSAWHREGAPEWSDVEIDDACRKALHAEGKELARITIAPIAASALTGAGHDFMDECAPADIFFPMGDILKIALVQVSPEFGAAQLTKPTDSRPFPGSHLAFERLDTAVDLVTPGGTLTLTALTPGRATLDMASGPMKLTMIHRRAYSGADVTLSGTETSVLRIEVNPATGVLLRAATTSDAFDMTMSLPGGYTQPLPFTREITIIPLGKPSA